MQEDKRRLLRESSPQISQITQIFNHMSLLKNSILLNLAAWWSRMFVGTELTPYGAAKTIQEFWDGGGGDWDWDDFTSLNQSSPEVALGLQLCFFFEGLYPAQHKREYCGQEANPYFRAVAHLLEAGQLRPFIGEETISSLKSRVMPKELGELLESTRKSIGKVEWGIGDGYDKNLRESAKSADKNA